MLLFDHFLGGKVLALTTQTEMDFSLVGSSGDLTESQSQHLARQCGFLKEKVFSVRQVHGDKIVVIDNLFSKGGIPGKADGILTGQKGVPIAIRTADCLPVFLFDPVHKAIGLVHAGWKGSYQAIVVKALLALKRHFQTSLADVQIILGPCIRDCCYEVGSEFSRYFPDEVSRKDGSDYCDLIAINRRQILEQGVKAKNISDCKVCTCCQAGYYSYRKQGAHAGRMLSLMMIKEDD